MTLRAIIRGSQAALRVFIKGSLENNQPSAGQPSKSRRFELGIVSVMMLGLIVFLCVPFNASESVRGTVLVVAMACVGLGLLTLFVVMPIVNSLEEYRPLLSSDNRASTTPPEVTAALERFRSAPDGATDGLVRIARTFGRPAEDALLATALDETIDATVRKSIVYVLLEQLRSEQAATPLFKRYLEGKNLQMLQNDHAAFGLFREVQAGLRAMGRLP